MKIKTKKTMNLPQLIEWAMKNDMHEKSFCGDRYGDAVHFDENEDMLCDHVSLTETFTVEVEEVVDKDTVIPKMLVVGRFDGYEEVYNQKLINFTQHLLSAYIIHDDGHMELIYDEEKGLVE